MRATLLVLIAAVAGCYNPSLQPCELACSNQTCPDGLTCNTQGLCTTSPTAMCDGAPIDAPIDAPTTGVTIQVLDPAGQPIPGADVIFIGMDGVVDEKTTGSDGRARVEMLPGGSATVVRSLPDPNGSGTDIEATTYLDLWEGANIINQPTHDQTPRSVMVEILPPPGAGPNFTVHASCATATSGTSRSVLMQIPVRCKTFDVLVTASASPTAQPTHAAFAAARTNGPVVIDANAWMPYRQVSGTLTNLPTAAFERRLAVGGFISPDLPRIATSFTDQVIPPSNTITGVPVPSGVGLATQVTLSYQAAAGGPISRQYIYDRFLPIAPDFTHDYKNEILPWIGDPVFSAAAQRLNWPSIVPNGLPAIEPSFFVASIEWMPDPNNSVGWRLIGPGSRISPSGNMQGVAYPAIPGTRIPPMPAIPMVDTVTLYQVSPAAVRSFIEIFDPATADVSYFRIPLGHLTMSQPPSPTP